MIYGPGSYYAGIVPETDALVGSNLTPMEKRANGGIDLLNQIHQEKMNAYYLGHPDGGIQFHIYMTKEPQLKDDGLPDMSGIKLRGAPIYREFFADYLGATFVQVNVPEVYTALGAAPWMASAGPRSASWTSPGTTSSSTGSTPATSRPTSASWSTSTGGTRCRRRRSGSSRTPRSPGRRRATSSCRRCAPRRTPR